MLTVGFFEGLDSERGIAWRCSDSFSLRGFPGYDRTQQTPDHSSLSKKQSPVALSHLPPVVHQILNQKFPGTVIHELRTREDNGVASYEMKLVNAENPKPFSVNGEGKIVRESEHLLHVDRVPVPLLLFCDLLRKDRSTWRVERRKNAERVYRYWSGEKPRFLQMYGVHYGDILARAGPNGGFNGWFKVAEDTGMARGHFAIAPKSDANHQVTIIR